MKKRISSLFLAVALALGIVCFAACDNKQPEPVVISVPQGVETQSLKSYMDTLQERGELTYSIRDGMVVSINGKSNAGKSYWMLYTSDEGCANNEWGSFEYDGKLYGSATLGATELNIKEGCLYIWAYQTF